MAGTVSEAGSEDDIHVFLADHAEGVGVIYYHDGDSSDDMDMINRFAELTDVLSIDSTDPQFKTNMKAGGVSSAPYVLGFHDKEADVREAPTDATVNKIGALVRLEAL